MDSGPVETGSPVPVGRGSTGPGAIVGIVLLAVAVVVGAIAWPKIDDGKSAAAAQQARQGTASTGRRIPTIHAWADAGGTKLLPSNDDVCGIVGISQLRTLTATPALFESPAVLDGGDNWGGVCRYFADQAGTKLALTIRYTIGGTDDLAASLFPELGTAAPSDPEACDGSASPKDPCTRIVALATLGEQAVATTAWVTSLGPPAFWSYPRLAFVQNGIQVEVDLGGTVGVTRHDQPARALALARTIAERLPTGRPVALVARPEGCPDSGKC